MILGFFLVAVPALAVDGDSDGGDGGGGGGWQHGKQFGSIENADEVQNVAKKAKQNQKERKNTMGGSTSNPKRKKQEEEKRAEEIINVSPYLI